MHLKIVASSLLYFSYAVNSVSISFTNNSPWTEGRIFRSEGRCSLSLDRTYNAKEWIITITVDNPTMQIMVRLLALTLIQYTMMFKMYKWVLILTFYNMLTCLKHLNLFESKNSTICKDV